MKRVKRNIQIPIVRENDVRVFLDHCYRTRHFNNLLIMAVGGAVTIARTHGVFLGLQQVPLPDWSSRFIDSAV